MLGFTPLAVNPLSSSATGGVSNTLQTQLISTAVNSFSSINLSASVSITGVVLNLNFGDKTLVAEANKTIPFTSLTSAVTSPTLSVDGNTSPLTGVTVGAVLNQTSVVINFSKILPSASSIFSINTLESIAEANNTLSPALVTTSPGTLGFDAEANLTTSAVTAVLGTTFTFTLDANIASSEVAAITNIENTVARGAGGADLNGITFEIAAVLEAGDGSGTTIGDALHVIPSNGLTAPSGAMGFDAKANHTIQGQASADINNSVVDFDAEANITTGTVNTSTSLVDITTFLEVDAAAELTSVFSKGIIELNAPANNLFDYDSFAEDYTVARTVYILSESSYNSSKVIHINPENFTLTIDAHRDLPTTVLITQ